MTAKRKAAGPGVENSADIDRKKFLGGSDCAAILGLSPWQTPLQVWAQKTGRASIEKFDPDRERRFRRGHQLEPFIRDMSIERLRDEGNDVELICFNQRYYDAELPFISVEIDYELMFNGEHINADAKSVSGFARKKWGEAGTEDIPIEYAVQFAIGQMVTGRETTCVAALRSFDDVDIYWSYYDAEIIPAMREKIADFWNNHVLTDVPPDPIRYPDIVYLYPSDNGEAVEANDEVYELVMQLDEVRRRKSRFEEAEKQLVYDIANYIRPASTLTYKGQPVITWKHQQQRRVDADALRKRFPDIWREVIRTIDMRVMRIPKRKGE